MSQFILGTAEFAPEGYGGKRGLPLAEIRSILACAKEGGITLLDTAESYGCQDVIRREAKGFCVYTKTRNWKVTLDWGDNELRGILYHYEPKEQEVPLPFIHRWVNLGVSVYEQHQLPENKLRILQIPFNLENQAFKECFTSYRNLFVRSVFGRGELLKTHSVKECLDFVKAYRPDGIIVGVNSARELEEILKA